MNFPATFVYLWLENYYIPMKEIQAIIRAYHQIDLAQTRAALATVVRVEGSSYRRTGARMLILENGTYLGGISGGCLEGDALRRAQKAIASEKASIVTYDTSKDDEQQIGVGLGCNGIIDVLFTPLKKIQNTDNQIDILEKIVETRDFKALITISRSKDFLGETLLYENDEQFLTFFQEKKHKQDVLNDVKNTLANQQSVVTNYDNFSVFIELITPTPHVIIHGGNYDIYPMSRILRELGWNVTVVMNVAKADKTLFQIGTKLLHPKGDNFFNIDAHTALILMAHDYKTDFENFQKALITNALYIGLLGPKKRTQKMYDALIADEKPVSEEDKSRIFSPAGLDIGAQTPEEIAVSIAAEIKAVFAKRNGGFLKHREGTIY